MNADEFRALKHERDRLAHESAIALIHRNPTHALELARQMHDIDRKLEADRITTTEGAHQS